MQSFNYEVFDRIIPTQEPHSMLTVFGSYVSNQSFKCPIFIKYSFGKFQSNRTKRYKCEFAKTDNIIKMLQSVPGKVLFRYQKSGNGGYSCKFNSDKVFEVNSFAWILPFADEIIQKNSILAN